MLKREKIVGQVKKFYNDYKAREVEKVLSRTDYEDTIQEFLKGKAKVDVLTAEINAQGQAERCVAFIRDNSKNKVIQMFLHHTTFKPAGLTTTAQLAHLCISDWKDIRNDVIDILEEARTTKVPDREIILHKAGFVNTPLLFIEHLLTTRLGISLFASTSSFYNGYNIKPKDIYDKQAESN